MLRACIASCLLLAASAAPAEASACAPCESGDPTLSVMGTAAPFAGRVRGATQLRVGWLPTEAGAGRTRMQTRADLSLAVAVSPFDWLTLSLDAPLTLVDVSRADLSMSTTLGPGDLTFRTRALILRARRLGPSNRLSVTAGVRAPTSVDQVDSNGVLLPVDAQTGSGAVAPVVGLSYVHAGDEFALMVRAEVAWPLAGRYGWTPGPSAELVVAPQVRVLEWLSVRAALGLRADAAARGQDQRRAVAGTTLSVSPELLLSPDSDWLIRAGVQIPLVQSDASPLAGGAAVFLGLAVDLGGLS